MAKSYLNTLQKGWLPVDHCVEGDLRSWSLLHNSTLYYGRSSCSTARVAASMTATWLISTDMSFHDYIINEALGCWLVNRNDRISDVPAEELMRFCKFRLWITRYPGFPLWHPVSVKNPEAYRRTGCLDSAEWMGLRTEVKSGGKQKRTNPWLL